MPKLVKLHVELIGYTHDAEQIIAAAIRQCYSAIGAKELKKKLSEKIMRNLIDQVINSGHTSTIEHALFTFAIEFFSRAGSHQLVRHRIASFSQQSQRYVKIEDEDSFEYIMPATIAAIPECKERFLKAMKYIYGDYKFYVEKGVPAEDARYELPNACATKIVVSMNPRSLYNFFKERKCARAQWEIRVLANKMYDLVVDKAPNLFKYAGPSCEVDLVCRQGKRSCNKWKSIKGARLIDPIAA